MARATTRLTFDDGPAEDTEQLLDVLARHAVRATFFLVGAQIKGRERTVERIAAEGHTIGNHSWNHPDLRALSLHAVRDQLKRTSDTIEAVTGTAPTLFRPPFGYTSTLIGLLAGTLGMRTILWDIDTEDWESHDPEMLATTIVDAPAGAVILLHDGPSSRRNTVLAVERALATAGESRTA